MRGAHFLSHDAAFSIYIPVKGPKPLRGSSALSFIKRRVLPVLCHRFVRRSDYFIAVYKLLYAVRRPARHAGHGKYGCIQLTGQAQHAVNKTAVKVNIGAYALIYPALIGYYLGRQPLHTAVQQVFLLQPLFLGKTAYKTAQYLAPGVGERIHRVAHTHRPGPCGRTPPC